MYNDYPFKLILFSCLWDFFWKPRHCFVLPFNLGSRSLLYLFFHPNRYSLKSTFFCAVFCSAQTMSNKLPRRWCKRWQLFFTFSLRHFMYGLCKILVFQLTACFAFRVVNNNVSHTHFAFSFAIICTFVAMRQPSFISHTRITYFVKCGFVFDLSSFPLWCMISHFQYRLTQCQLQSYTGLCAILICIMQCHSIIFYNYFFNST